MESWNYRLADMTGRGADLGKDRVTRLELDVFGRRILVVRRTDRWEVFYLGGEGKRRRAEDISIPDAVPENELEHYVADLCHEWATSRNPKVIRIR
jgi:hypothetical protein